MCAIKFLSFLVNFGPLDGIFQSKVKDLGVWLDKKLYFHHVNYIFSVASKLLGLIKFITYNFSSLDSLLVLYVSLGRSKLEYACIAWNNLTITDSNKNESIQNKFAHLFYPRFYQFDSPRHYDVILERLVLRTLHSRQRHLDALSLINVLTTKLIASLLRTLLVFMYLLNELGIFPSVVLAKHLGLVLLPDARPWQ
jgi:hypothetical protein